MFLHLIIIAALLSTGTQHGRVAGSTVAFVHRIPADVQAMRLHAPANSTRPVADSGLHRSTRPVSQPHLTLTTQLRR